MDPDLWFLNEPRGCVHGSYCLSGTAYEENKASGRSVLSSSTPLPPLCKSHREHQEKNGKTTHFKPIRE